MFKDIFKDDLNIKHTWYILDRYLYICLQEFYPDKKPLEAKAKKDYGMREKFDGFSNCDHCLHDHLSMQTVRTRNFIMKMIMMMMVIIVIITSSLKQGTRHTKRARTLTHFICTLRYLKHVKHHSMIPMGDLWMNWRKIIWNNLLTFQNITGHCYNSSGSRWKVEGSSNSSCQ